MNRNPRGYATILLIIAAVALFALGAFAYSRYSAQDQTGGATVYTTQLSDTFNTFREEVNSSTANLNTELETVSGTVDSFGSIVSQNSPLPVNAGGTGTTTAPTNAQFLSASGSTPTWKSLTFGSGFNSTTTPTSVVVSTQGIDTTANYSWTGSQTFSSTTILSNVTSSVLYTNSSGKIAGTPLSGTGNVLTVQNGTLTAGLGTVVTVTSTSYAVTSSVQLGPKLILPTASTDSIYEFTMQFTLPNLQQSTPTTTFAFVGGGVSSTFLNVEYQGTATTSVNIWGRLFMQGSTSSEILSLQLATTTGQWSSTFTQPVQTFTLNLASNPSIQIYLKEAAATTTNSYLTSTVYMIQ